jgi:hypothetical protein
MPGWHSGGRGWASDRSRSGQQTGGKPGSERFDAVACQRRRVEQERAAEDGGVFASRRFLVFKRLVRRFLAGLGIGMLVVIRGDRGSDD